MIFLTKKGIDISKWQGNNIDFDKVKDAGVEFVIMRCGYRDTVDPCFYSNVSKAKQAGLPVIGVYFFGYALNKEQAVKEAEFCTEILQNAGLDKDIYVFYDFEYDSIAKAKALGVILGASECNGFTDAFCSTIQDAGYKAGVYANMDYYKHMYNKNMLAKYVFWLADYSGKATVPCIFHQYSSTGSVPGISGNVDLDYFYETEIAPTEKSQRELVVDLARSWLGLNEQDGTHKEIIDTYNSLENSQPLPRGVKMSYDMAWCAAFWSALAVKLGLTDIMPIEISCYYLIEEAKKMGCWVEDDSYVPMPADGILYDWDDGGKGDDTGSPEHVGVVEYVSDGYIGAIEGNYCDSVKRRIILLNGRYIRGYITPKYTSSTVPGPSLLPGKTVDEIAKEVITGLWGNGAARKAALEQAGYTYQVIQSRVNEMLNPVSNSVTNALSSDVEYASGFADSYKGEYEVTAKSGLHLRCGAGMNKKSLMTMPYKTRVRCYGWFSKAGDIVWLYLNCNDVIGFASLAYLKKV